MPPFPLSVREIGVRWHLSVPRLAAVATANPDICAHIPANQRVNQVAAPLRDWCFYTVAFYTQDIRVCDRMTLSAAEATVLAVKAAGVRPEIAEQMGLHAECARIAKRLGPRLHYGPEVPSDDHQTQRLFTVLGVVSHRLMTGHQTRLRGVLSAVS